MQCLRIFGIIFSNGYQIVVSFLSQKSFLFNLFLISFFTEFYYRTESYIKDVLTKLTLISCQTRLPLVSGFGQYLSDKLEMAFSAKSVLKLYTFVVILICSMLQNNCIMVGANKKFLKGVIVGTFLARKLPPYPYPFG